MALRKVIGEEEKEKFGTRKNIVKRGRKVLSKFHEQFLYKQTTENELQSENSPPPRQTQMVKKLCFLCSPGVEVYQNKLLSLK